MARDKALVLLSGGLDSATCLYWAKKKFADVRAITFNYYGRVGREMRAANALAKSAGVSDVIEIALPFVKEMSDNPGGKKRRKSGDLWSSYVPARNMMFYSIAAHHAELLGINRIVAGHNSHDVGFFRDASSSYINKLNSLFRLGCLLCNGKSYKIILPLAKMKREEIIKLAISLKTPIELTWSCHRDGETPCGNCYACRQRGAAFRRLRISDPALTH